MAMHKSPGINKILYLYIGEPNVVRAAMSKLFYFAALFIAIAGYSQTQPRQAIVGKVTAGLFPLKDILVINISSQREVRTDSIGFFKIAVRAGDSIAVTAPKITTKNFVLSESDIKSNFLHVEASPSYELEEVVINSYSHINSVSLGIVPAGMKLPTVAERRLSAGSSDPLGGLINLITGKTKMLKMNLEIERREFALSRLENLFDDTFFTEELKLEKDLVAGFKYYVVENSKIRYELQVGERGIVAFLLVDLAREYIKMVSDEE